MSLDDELERLMLTEQTAFYKQERASLEEIEALEQRIGFVLDPDYREFLQRIGGFQDPDPERGGIPVGANYGIPGSYNSLDPLQNVEFYPVSGIEWVRNRVHLDVYNDGLVEDGSLVEPEWGNYLIPFCGRHPMNTYCFDYYFDRDRPPVVSVHADAEWERSRDFNGVDYVADSFVGFLSLMEIIHHGDPPFPRRLRAETAQRTQWTERVYSWLGV